MAQLPHDPLRVGIFYRLTWLRCLRLEKALLPRLGCGLRVLQLETWFGPLHQSHIGSGALPDPWSFGSWTSSSTGSWLWSASERTPGRALLFDQP